MSVVEAIVMLCLLTGDPCEYVESARITHYVIELGGVNCEPFCDGWTATMTPAVPGIVAACAPERLGQSVYVEGVGWRECQDTGGAITGDEVDVLVGIEDCQWVGEFCAHEYSGDREVVFFDE